MSAHICHDLLVEIFARLQPKSLLRFRSLSKSLCSCIDSPAFRRLHSLRSSQKVMIIHDLYNRKEKYHQHFYTLHSKEQLPFRKGTLNGFMPLYYKGIKPFKVPFRNAFIYGSCNGIFCLVDIWKGIYLWNPSIKRKVILPDIPSWPFFSLFGFGYDPITDDYKIVVISIFHIQSSFVYSMKTCTWCDIGSPAGFLISTPPRACFFNGALHWAVTRYSDDGIHHRFILTFDLSTDELGEMELPELGEMELPAPYWKTRHITIIEGCLAMISTNDIWVMREYNNAASWCRVFKLPKAEFKRIWTVFPFTVNGELVMNVAGNKGLTTYNLERRLKSRLMDLYFFSRTINMEVFVESLELLNTGTVCEEHEPSDLLRGEKENQTTHTGLQYYFERFRGLLSHIFESIVRSGILKLFQMLVL